ncbi:hypothetical protein PVAG01_08951 [Phlyctema vagabunda]|uniref:Uncharacterized protein n=1 Tax=Phlyctema vagabunda TaxID=108571 RepID=A0ABR4PAV6_9HELO
MELKELPMEIRSIIFNECLYREWDATSSKFKTPALLIALRPDEDLYTEALDIFYEINSLKFNCRMVGADLPRECWYLESELCPVQKRTARHMVFYVTAYADVGTTSIPPKESSDLYDRDDIAFNVHDITIQVCDLSSPEMEAAFLRSLYKHSWRFRLLSVLRVKLMEFAIHGATKSWPKPVPKTGLERNPDDWFFQGDREWDTETRPTELRRFREDLELSLPSLDFLLGVKALRLISWRGACWYTFNWTADIIWAVPKGTRFRIHKTTDPWEGGGSLWPLVMGRKKFNGEVMNITDDPDLVGTYLTVRTD